MRYVWWALTGQSDCGRLLWACILLAVASGCYSEKTQESTAGTIGKAGVNAAVRLFTEHQYNAKESERAQAVAALIESETARQAEETLRIAAEETAARLQRADKLHRIEIDGLKEQKTTWLAQIDRLSTRNVSADCPLGDAAYIRASLVWLRDNRRTRRGGAEGGGVPAPAQAGRS